MSELKYLLSKEPKPTEIPAPFLIVVEGMGDARFIHHLLEHIGIASCCIVCPSREGFGGGNGYQAIPKLLLGLKSLKWQSGRGILIMVDADDDIVHRFAEVQTALREAEFPAPQKPFSIEGDPFRVAVFLIPGDGGSGTLEDVLIAAALKEKPDMKDCLDTFCECTGKVKTWTPNKRSKARLSALVAVSCKHNPWASDNLMWSCDDNPVPIESDCFNHISAFLKDFTS